MPLAAREAILTERSWLWMPKVLATLERLQERMHVRAPASISSRKSRSFTLPSIFFTAMATIFVKLHCWNASSFSLD